MSRLLAVGVTLVLLSGAAWGEEQAALATEAERLGYSIGYQVGGDFRRDGTPLEIDLVVEGVLDALEGNEPRHSRDEMRESLTRLRRESEAARRDGAGGPEAP